MPDRPNPSLKTRRAKIEVLSRYLRLNGSGLELGPHIAPMFRRSDGLEVRYLESRGGDELRALVTAQGGDPAVVEDIDYILQRGKSLAEHVGARRFDYVASSHVVEHIPDFLGHLREVAEVLVADGTYGLVVPDMNYCFDCLKSPTLLGQVIENHLTGARPGAMAHMINEWRYGARPRGVAVGGWSDAEAAAPLVGKTPDWKARVHRAIATGGQGVDTWFGHQWFFDPRNFGEILCDLMELGLVPFQLSALVPSHHMDFIAVLDRTDTPDVARARALVAEVATRYHPPVYDRTVASA